MEDSTKRRDDEELALILLSVAKAYAAKSARTDSRREIDRVLEKVRYGVKSRKHAPDFVRYFTDEVCSPGVVPADGYDQLAGALLSRPEQVRSAFLLALVGV